MKQTILVAEDDSDIRQLVQLYLESEGYQVICAENGRQALELAETYEPQLAILDIMMPEFSGLEVVKILREKTMMPILILSARDQDEDKILGLDIGADDYLTKPFNPLEMVARARALLRRTASTDEVAVGSFTLDIEGNTIRKKGKALSLTPIEYKLFSKLLKSPGKIFTKVQLYESVCGEYFEGDDNTVMVHISRLRDKVEDDPKRPKHIVTVRGVGYKFEA
ncbi:MAG: response regulator transcription factor [Firmicutes bacterium]|nr:response regulator transcription factor [Bacillota bacterium]